MGSVGNPANLIDPEQHRTTPLARVACGRGQLRVACLAIRFCVGCALIIRLIIQTILLYPSGAVWTDEASNVSSLDPSGADQADAEHPSDIACRRR
jgi:hypothetical protein